MKKQRSLYEPSFHFEENFEEERLFSLAKWMNGATFKSSDYTKQGLPIIKIAEIKNGITNQTRFSNLSEKKNYLIKKNDFLFSWSGQPETSIDIFHFAYGEGLLNQHIYKIDPVEIKIRKDYFFYLMKYLKKTFIKIAQNKQTTGLGHVTKKDLEKITVKFPSNKNDQKSISKILKSIDEKIELNKKNNETLEEIGKTLFKSWFTNFEPVRAKVEGRSTGLPDEISDLFPDSFEDSELGNIPINWSVQSFEEVIYEYIDNRGKTPPIQSFDIPLVEVKHLASQLFPNLKTEKFVSREIFSNWFRKYVQKYDVLISTVGTIGLTSIVFDPNFAIAQNVLGLRFENKELSLYMFYLIKNFYFQHQIKSRLVETVQKSIKRKDINQIPIIVPDKIILEKFAAITDPFIERQFLMSKEIETLESLRNILLPKLISGEVRISDAEKFIDKVDI